MADAYGKLTGRPGVCLVTRGPGATHASNGLHTAAQDSTPMLLLVGQVARGAVGREGFQELDYRAVFGSMAKWVAQIDDAARIPELVARAFAGSDLGPPGPGRPRAAGGHARRRGRRARRAVRTGRSPPRRPGRRRWRGSPSCSPSAERPLAIVGEGGWTARTGPGRRRVRRGAARAGRRVVPLPGLRRQPLPRLRGPRDAGHGPRARGADPRRGRAARDRRAPGRDHDRRLHARAPAGAGAAAGPRPPRSRRAGDGLHAGARHRLRPRGVRRCCGEARAGDRTARACSRRPMRTTSATCTTCRSCPARCRCPPSWRRCASGSARTRSSPTARATSRSGRTATTSSAATARSSRRAAARWVTACPRPSRRRPSTPIGPSCASRATATSS